MHGKGKKIGKSQVLSLWKVGLRQRPNHEALKVADLGPTSKVHLPWDLNQRKHMTTI